MATSSDGHVALITGSSRGLGASIARQLASTGGRVAVNGIDAAETDRVATSIRDAGGDANAYVFDVTESGHVADLVASVESDLGPIDVVVINATGPQPEAPIAEVGWDAYLDQLDFFVKSPILLGSHIIPGMIDRKFGRIINIDSEVAHRPPPGRSAYATAKNAQIGLTRAWARELAPHGITVNTVAPGFIPVERHLGLADEIARYASSVPVGRTGTPDEIAHAVAFFASPLAGFITGQRLIVDGGRSLAG